MNAPFNKRLFGLPMIRRYGKSSRRDSSGRQSEAHLLNEQLQPFPLSRKRVYQHALDEMLAAEVGSQVHNLPAPEADEQHGRSDAEPLDAGVGALVCVSQFLLSRAQVVHLGDNLGNGLLDAAELTLDGLELLGGLDGGPVLGIGTDIDVEFDMTVGVVRPCKITFRPLFDRLRNGQEPELMCSERRVGGQTTYFLSIGSQSRRRRQHRRAK